MSQDEKPSYQKLLLLLETLLEKELGKYKHESDVIVPSLRIIPPPIPDDLDFVPESGIAGAILKTPQSEVSSQGGTVIEDKYWRVFLAQRDLSDSVYKAQSLIAKLIPSSKVSTAQQEKTAQTIKYERAIISIPEWDDFDSELFWGNDGKGGRIDWVMEEVYGGK